MPVRQKIKQFVTHHHWKVLNLVCCLALTWQMCGIMREWLYPTQETIRITEKKLSNIEFPLVIKICPDPGFNYSAAKEEGYDSIWGYFLGMSRHANESIDMMYGWAGHTNTSETRGTVDEIYHKLANYPTPDDVFTRRLSEV